jgi:pyruvate dehydrogenase E2 component (dihydrolipoamide acetyltransferase)
VSGPRRIAPFWAGDDDDSETKGQAAMPAIQAITMPKWGLAMEEGMLARWAVEEGATISLADEIMDIETSKIANVFESPVAGVLRRKVTAEGDTVPVGASRRGDRGRRLHAEVEAFVADFLASSVAEADADAPTAEPITVEGGPSATSGWPGRRHADHHDPRLRRRPVDLMFNRGRSPPTGCYALDLPGHGGSSRGRRRLRRRPCQDRPPTWTR